MKSSYIPSEELPEHLRDNPMAKELSDFFEGMAGGVMRQLTYAEDSEEGSYKIVAYKNHIKALLHISNMLYDKDRVAIKNEEIKA